MTLHGLHRSSVRTYDKKTDIMRNVLHPIAIMPICFVFVLSNTSFAQRSNVEHVPLIHPGIMMTGEQLDLMRDRINNGIEPQKSAFDVLTNDRRAVKDYTANTEHFKWGSGERDAQACWVQALMWSVTQEEVYAENAMNIMDAYSTLVEVTGTNKDLRIGLMGTMFMRGAEIVKHTYPKWRPETEKVYGHVRQGVHAYADETGGARKQLDGFYYRITHGHCNLQG